MMTNTECDPGLTRRDQRNLRPLRLYAVIWAASFMFAHLFLPTDVGGPGTMPFWAWPVLAISIVFGSLLAHAYWRFIREADELLRKIHIEALAVGFGVAFVFGMGANLFDQVGIPKVAQVTWAVMLLAYSLRLRISRKAYCE